MPGHYFAHELRNFARRVELTGLLTRIGSEVANQIFVNEAEGIVILPAVHRNVLDEVDEGEHTLAGWIDVAFKSGKRITYVGDGEIALAGNPCGEQVVVGDKVAAQITYVLHGLGIILIQALEIFISPVFSTKTRNFRL